MAQQMEDTLKIYFRVGMSAYDATFMENGKRANEFMNRIKDFQKQSEMLEILNVTYKASASPEGSLAGNERLSQKRSQNITNWLHGKLDFDESVVHYTSVSEDWDGLTELVTKSNDIPSKDEVMEILTGDDDNAVKKTKVMALGGGSAWRYMNANLFKELRYFTIFVTVGLKLPDAGEPEVVEDSVEVETPFDTLDTSLSVAQLALPEPAPEWVRRLYLKTNAIGWGMFMSNVAVEIDLSRHFSFQLPIYYSALNYFSSDLKFRAFLVQPEFRYWFNRPEGLFIGAHGGMAYFNYATKGDWRVQTGKDGDRPLWGGGLAAGYRMPLSKKHPRWHVEFSLGAGVYDVYYEKFYNEKNGAKAKQGHDTFIGVDHAAVSFVYSFNLKTKAQKASSNTNWIYTGGRPNGYEQHRNKEGRK